jgi:hypothetical protein
LHLYLNISYGITEVIDPLHCDKTYSFIYLIFVTSNNTHFCPIVVASTGFYFPAILFSLSGSYNLIIYYELALLMVICPFPAILFSLSASYNLIIFYELVLLLVICPFPAILFSLSASYNLIIFYELALLLVICPFPAILFSLSAFLRTSPFTGYLSLPLNFIFIIRVL